MSTLRFIILSVAVFSAGWLSLISLPSRSSAAELQYQEIVQVNNGVTTRTLAITARQDDQSLWRMVVNLGRSDNHAYYTPGTISSFQDLQWPRPDGVAPFEYVPMPANGTFGLMRFSKLAGTFSDQGGRLPQYYRFKLTNVLRPGLSVVLTFTIYAPQVQACGYRTDISAECTVVNARSDAAEIAPLGLQNMNLNLNVDGLFDYMIVNPPDATVKPVLHDVIPIDGHPMYIIEDWYGDIAHLFDGPMMRMTVRDCPVSAARAMRPGMSFEISAPGMSLADVKVLGLPAGQTFINSAHNLHARLLENRLTRPIAGMTHVPAGGQVTMAYQGSITAPSPQAQDDAGLGVTVHLSTPFVYQNAELTTADGHNVAVTVQVVDGSGSSNGSYAVSIEQVEGPGQVTIIDDPEGNELKKYMIGSRRNKNRTGAGMSRWRVVVSDDVGGSGSAEFDLHVRLLGDVDGNGFVTPNDMGILNNRLNGIAIEDIPTRAFDVDASGFVTTSDLGLLMNILNGVDIR